MVDDGVLVMCEVFENGGQVQKNVISFLNGALSNILSNCMIIRPHIKSHVVNWSTTFPLNFLFLWL